MDATERFSWNEVKGRPPALCDVMVDVPARRIAVFSVVGWFEITNLHETQQPLDVASIQHFNLACTLKRPQIPELDDQFDQFAADVNKVFQFRFPFIPDDQRPRFLRESTMFTHEGDFSVLKMQHPFKFSEKHYKLDDTRHHTLMNSLGREWKTFEWTAPIIGSSSVQKMDLPVYPLPVYGLDGNLIKPMDYYDVFASKKLVRAEIVVLDFMFRIPLDQWIACPHKIQLLDENQYGSSTARTGR
ncbi:hypothetical protein BJ165DRAFT_1515870 [Panaeolus papilionaceus]|nr:hypothetical protein BJ165DRAFT_1515870 [Panaeolus papilionaceus]